MSAPKICERCEKPGKDRAVVWYETPRLKRVLYGRAENVTKRNVVSYALCDDCTGLLRYSLGGKLVVHGWDWIDAVDALHYVPPEVEREYRGL